MFRLGRIPWPVSLLQPLCLSPSLSQASKLWVLCHLSLWELFLSCSCCNPGSGWASGSSCPCRLLPRSPGSLPYRNKQLRWSAFGVQGNSSVGTGVPCVFGSQYCKQVGSCTVGIGWVNRQAPGRVFQWTPWIPPRPPPPLEGLMPFIFQYVLWKV